jgi:formate dehydrogenase subunit delta
MKPKNMVHDVNQIALFFSSYPHDEALAGVVKHLQMYWEPRMKSQIKAYVAEGGSGLLELAVEAVKQLS